MRINKRRLGLCMPCRRLFCRLATGALPRVKGGSVRWLMTERLGFIGVVLNDRAAADDVNRTLGQYAARYPRTRRRARRGNLRPP